MTNVLILYLAMVVIGILIGAKKQLSQKKVRIIQKLQTIALIVLIFTMGVKIGMDERVISSIGSIGVQAFIITAGTMAGSVFAVFLGRKILGINSKGNKEND